MACINPPVSKSAAAVFYIAEQPDILFLKDSDGDDKADVKVRKLFGFDTADSHHGIAAFEWGPDGALYFQEGTFKQSQVETPYGLQRLGDAGVWRYDPRTERLDVHASLAFANPWGTCLMLGDRTISAMHHPASTIGP